MSRSILKSIAIDLVTGTEQALTDRRGPDQSPVPFRRTAGKSPILGFDDRHLGYQATQLYVMDIDGKNSRARSPRGLDRDAEVAAMERRWPAAVFPIR